MTETLIPGFPGSDAADMIDPLSDPEASFFMSAMPGFTRSFSQDSLLTGDYASEPVIPMARYAADKMTQKVPKQPPPDESPEETSAEDTPIYIDIGTSDDPPENPHMHVPAVTPDETPINADVNGSSDPPNGSTDSDSVITAPVSGMTEPAQTSPGSGNSDPPSPPVIALDPVSGDEDGEKMVESDDSASLRTNLPINRVPYLTSYPAVSEEDNGDEEPGFWETIVSGGKRIINTAFNLKPELETMGNIVPYADPPPRNPVFVLKPDEQFSAGYISQRDLETALGREAWTMCCASTFVYATQMKYPEMERDVIIEAAGVAADTKLLDGTAKCVADDGTVASVYQFSQAFARELGLKEYVDVVGVYKTEQDAIANGAEMMKVEISATAQERSMEHHIFKIRDSIIDPIPGEGSAGVYDDGSIKTEQVMSLGWCNLPQREETTDEIGDKTEDATDETD